jgi:hypothetical protein
MRRLVVVATTSYEWSKFIQDYGRAKRSELTILDENVAS